MGTDPGMSDPLGKFYVPYIGIRGKGRKCCGCETVLCYKWRFIGSPLIWNTWNDPFLINCAERLADETDPDALHIERQQRVFLGR